MKKLIILAAVAVMGLNASAQFVGQGSSSTSSTEISKGWNTAYVQYNNVGIAGDLGDLSDETANGASIGYSRAFNIVPTIPLYVEAGIAAQFLYKSKSEKYYDDDDLDLYDEEKYSGYMLSAKVPVNVLYRFVIPNTEFAIEPLVGLDLRVNILGKYKLKYTYWDYDYPSYEIKYHSDEDSYNFFDKKDMGGNPAKRFQIGWHIGSNFAFKNYVLGFQYGQDFNKIADFVRLRTITLSLGYRF